MKEPSDTRAIKEIIREELPKIMQTDEEVARFILRISTQYYAGKIETEDRFDRILKEMEKDREEQKRRWEEQNLRWEEENSKWEEQNRRWEEDSSKWEENSRRWEEENSKWEEDSRRWEEQNRRWNEQNSKWEEDSRRWNEQNSKWEEQNRKWDEQNRKWDENQKVIMQVFDEIKIMNRRYDQSIGSLGARWGLRTEASFRNALASILEETFKVKVIHCNEFDKEGTVFGQPEQVELDLIIKNGILIICEIKSSMSKSDMYTFEKKVRFYEDTHHARAQRKMVISPMVDDKAKKVAEDLGIEVHSYADEVH